MGILATTLGLSQTNCLSKFAANSTVRVMQQAAPAVNSFADPAIAEGAIPYSISQSEGLLLVVPENVALRVNLMRTYGSYGFAFLEDRLEEAEVNDDEARMQHYTERASMAYRRARQIGFETMTMEEGDDGGAEGAMRRGVDAWRAYLQRFDDAEQAPIIFWTGYAMGRYISLHREDPDAIADLPYAIACFERTLQLDPSYNYYAPHAAMGAYYARAAPSLGGEPDRARASFEEAIRRTNRHFLTYLVLYARAYAVMMQDRALYQRLLQEVIDAGDVMPEQRLANQIAKRRARRYLAQIDNLFGPAEEGASSGEGASAETPASGEGATTEGEAPATEPTPAPAPAPEQ